MNSTPSPRPLLESREVRLLLPGAELEGSLTLPEEAPGLVLFAHGSGSSRHSPRNRYVAEILQSAGLATLLMDLLTHDKDAVDRFTRQFRFNIGLLAERLTGASTGSRGNRKLENSPLACSAPALVRRPPCRPRLLVPAEYKPSSAAVVVRTWRERRSHTCGPRPC